MENATKALIVVIALGVRIMNSSSDTTDRVDTVATTTSIQSFNAQFEPYIGRKLNKTEYQNLKILINTSNKHTTQQVNLDDQASGQTNISYEVHVDYDDDTGYINKLTITKYGVNPTVQTDDEG